MGFAAALPILQITTNHAARSNNPETNSFGARTAAKAAELRPSLGRFQPEHDPEKWTPVFRKDHAATKKPDHDPIQFDRIMV
jgi:hypothetical protein